MYDISAANLVSVSLLTGIGSVEFKKEDFSADGSPVRIERATAATAVIDMEQKLVPMRSLNPVILILSPIPNTDTDLRLKKLLLYARSQPANSSKAKIPKIEIQFLSGDKENTLTLTDGFEVGGNLGIETLSEGRYATGSYEFQFSVIEGKLEAPINWAEWKKDEEEQKKPPQKKAPAQWRVNPKKAGATFYFGQGANGGESRAAAFYQR